MTFEQLLNNLKLILMERASNAMEASVSTKDMIPHEIVWNCDDQIEAICTPSFLLQMVDRLVKVTAEKEIPRGGPPEPVAKPSKEWCDAYAAWYFGE